MATLVPTKFYLPQTPSGFVARPQLFKRLDEVLNHRLALVSAPAGAGKTTIISAWVQSINIKEVTFGWLSLDESDNDLRGFLEYLKTCFDEAGVIIDTDGETIGRGDSAQAQSVITEIIRGLITLKRALILTLDDYHLIQNKEIHATVEYMIEHAPPGLHIIILTRSDPPFELARLRVRGQLLELRMDQLRFSEQETAAFLNLSAGVQLPENEVSALNARTEGWIAGLQMAAISLRGRTDASSFVTAFTASNRFVFDYLLEQILNRQPAEVREFLLKTAILERLNASLCEAVAETGNKARGLLDIIERENLFLIPLDDERGWYRYHHLFANLLRLLLEQNHPDLSAELHRRACRWYEVQDMISEALQHALASGDMQLAAQIVSSNVLVLIENNEIGPILQKFDSIPYDELIAHPWLGIARAWALGTEKVPKSIQALKAAEKNLESLTDAIERRRMQGHIAAARAFVYGSQGELNKAILAAKEANDLLPQDEFAIRAMNLIIWGDILVEIGKIIDATTILEQALALAHHVKRPHITMIATGSLATAYLFAGRLHEIHRVCLEGLEISDDYQRQYRLPLSASAQIYPLLARALAEWGQNQKAIQFAQKGLALSKKWGRINAEYQCLLYLGRTLIFDGNWEQAREILRLSESMAQMISPSVVQKSAYFTLDTLLDSEAIEVEAIAQQRQHLGNSGAVLPKILAARLMIRDNQPEDALKMLDQALSEINDQPSFDIVRIYALRAIAFQAKGETKLALPWLQQALELGEPENRIASFVREGPAMEKLLQVARTKAMVPEFVKRLLTSFEARHKHKPKPIPMPQALIEPLSKRELEVLQYLNSHLSIPEIADLLVVSANTVRTQVKNIYGKLGVHGRSGAVQRARELSLLA